MAGIYPSSFTNVIYFGCKFTLKQNFMKIEFENSIRRFFIVLSDRHQNCLDKQIHELNGYQET